MTEPFFWVEQAQILGRAGKKPPMAPATSAQHVQCAAAITETALAETKAPVQSPIAAEAQARSSSKDVLAPLDVNRGNKRKPKDAVPAPGTPKMATPVKRPVSADLPRKAHAHNIYHSNGIRMVCEVPCGPT